MRRKTNKPARGCSAPPRVAPAAAPFPAGGKHKLRSVTQCDDLEELMSQAVLANTDFTSRRGEAVLVGSEGAVPQLPQAAGARCRRRCRVRARA